MKTLDLKEMEVIEGGGWGSFACRMAFGVAGALAGGPVGMIVGGTVGNVLCFPFEAH